MKVNQIESKANEFVQLFNEYIDETYFDELDIRWFIYNQLLNDYLYKCRQFSDYKEFVEKLIVLGEKIGYDMVSLVMDCLFYMVKEYEVEGNKEQAEKMRNYIKELEKASVFYH